LEGVLHVAGCGIKLHERKRIFREPAEQAECGRGSGALKVVHAIGFKNKFAYATGNGRGHDANFFPVKPLGVFGGCGSAVSGAAGFAHVKDLSAVRIEAHDIRIVVAIHEKFRRGGSQSLRKIWNSPSRFET
jgi:hypothetical protein